MKAAIVLVVLAALNLVLAIGLFVIALHGCTLEVSPRFGQHTGNGPTIVGTKPLPKDAGNGDD